ncbi:hypothetical protein K458DRAFT_398318 [Lentithecium fluviatile CBS 122367]|uniref:Uncharacterized protein n=1 Tax=Lentithecium fluviatile CBS 122367 TaxID=1168545 RepID=A0A6G1JP61_9PLEO|nr:hypothetical protein K458DRAFT_398318 [Lentithecium fluviatile CBS 122367]
MLQIPKRGFGRSMRYAMDIISIEFATAMAPQQETGDDYGVAAQLIVGDEVSLRENKEVRYRYGRLLLIERVRDVLAKHVETLDISDTTTSDTGDDGAIWLKHHLKQLEILPPDDTVGVLKSPRSNFLQWQQDLLLKRKANKITETANVYNSNQRPERCLILWT